MVNYSIKDMDVLNFSKIRIPCGIKQNISKNTPK